MTVPNESQSRDFGESVVAVLYECAKFHSRKIGWHRGKEIWILESFSISLRDLGASLLVNSLLIERLLECEYSWLFFQKGCCSLFRFLE